jgi:hypothetical protein
MMVVEKAGECRIKVGIWKNRWSESCADDSVARKGAYEVRMVWDDVMPGMLSIGGRKMRNRTRRIDDSIYTYSSASSIIISRTKYLSATQRVAPRILPRQGHRKLVFPPSFSCCCTQTSFVTFSHRCNDCRSINIMHMSCRRVVGRLFGLFRNDASKLMTNEGRCRVGSCEVCLNSRVPTNLLSFITRRTPIITSIESIACRRVVGYGGWYICDCIDFY